MDAEAGSKTARYSLPDGVWLAFALSAAIYLRWTHFDANPTFDELWNLGLTRGVGSPLEFEKDIVLYEPAARTSLHGSASLLSVWSGLDGILHPPLYLILLRMWREVFGESDKVAQSISMLCGLVTVGFTYASARLAMNRTVAGLCAMTLACSQTQIYFGQEIRPYALLMAFGSAALWIMTRANQTQLRAADVRGLVLLMFLMQMTHYFAFGANLAIVLFVWIKARTHRRSFLRWSSAAATVYAVVWLPFAWRQISSIQTGDAMVGGALASLPYVLLNAAGAPFRVLAERNFELDLLPCVSGVLFLLPWLLFRRLGALLPWVLWLCCSIGGVVLLDLVRGTGSVALVRYLAICTPAVPLLFAGVGWALRRWLAYVSIAIAWFTGFIYLLSGNIVWVDSLDYSDIARAIARRIGPRDAIVTYEPPGGGNAGTWMVTVSHHQGLFPRRIACLTKPMSEQMLNQLQAPSIWLITGGSDLSPEEIVPGTRVIGAYGGSPGVSVTHLLRIAPTTAPKE